MASLRRGRSRPATSRHHTASHGVWCRAVRPLVARNRASSMYPHSRRAAAALPSVHQDICPAGSYERAHCTSRRRLVTRDRARPCRDPSFAIIAPQTHLAKRLGTQAGHKAGTCRTSSFRQGDMLRLAIDMVLNSHPSGSFSVEQRQA